jgi:hypothetical protein
MHEVSSDDEPTISAVVPGRHQGVWAQKLYEAASAVSSVQPLELEGQSVEELAVQLIEVTAKCYKWTGDSVVDALVAAPYWLFSV